MDRRTAGRQPDAPWEPSPRRDSVPADDDAREQWFRDLAHQATVFGLPIVWQHALLQREAAERPMSTFSHERDLARPGFAAFRVPNVDTLYSSAWIDLTSGPVDVCLPDFGDRYFTVQLLDAASNTQNISRRTIGAARRIRLVSPESPGSPDVPDEDGVVTMPVGSPVTWALMRIQVGTHDLAEVRALQDAVALVPLGGPSVLTVEPAAGDVEDDADAFLTTLDSALRLQGHRLEETALVMRLRQLAAIDDEPARRGVERGYREALALLDASRPLLGTRTGSGWTRVADKGRHGYNYLNRAVMNFVGLAANVVDENTSFNTYVDEHGVRLDGRAGASYRLVLDPPPTTDAFWSVTLYEASTGHLWDAPEGRYSVGSLSGGRDTSAGDSITISHERPAGGTWLPAPAGEFFLVLRVYSPGPDVVSGDWIPAPVRPVRPAGSTR
ncbi:DUF1254 domain-containing protein [Aeromicrobium endophyticum]|uniref:DUF1254 domain-containing protein n=1 Tax=Aeromicrobium endophyticum TaxID=2292704 RepID=A0A371P9Q4_9ACTN|nr:DUF1254 domain-containing protein [Aeromicrobium endophyticum]REK72687.1 DUF1254 domain-containing protein [Aeromicrobium endophyticum]